ncbi:MAG TPA: DNA gyrase inhibitor YacG [Burkholderiales bacterium]|nr:DNA gyrase inhibitor YacG [Burkholderiales bacterium]
MKAGARYVSCPRCGAQVAWAPESRHRPFCSERCRTVDLGAWATEQYCVAAIESGEEIEDTAPPETSQ